MLKRSKNNSNKFTKKDLIAVFVIGFLGLLMINSLSLNALTLNLNLENLRFSSPGPAVDSDLNNFRVTRWDTDNVTEAEVQSYANILEDAYNLLVGTWNLPDPMLGFYEPPVEVIVEPWEGYNGWANGPMRESGFSTGVYPAYINQGFASDQEPLGVAGHEFAHLTQYAHPGYPATKFAREGQARMIEDKLSDWLDHTDGTQAGSSFLRETQGYLGATHNLTLTSLTYPACLFWQYYCEQFGIDHTDPDYGIDAITTFWNTTVNPYGTDEITMMNNALEVLSPGTTFEDVFEDFSVAIYAKDFNSVPIPGKWTFIDDDEIDGSGNYGTVSREINPIPTLTSAGTIEGNSEVINSWSNKYYEVDIDPDVATITMNFNQTTNNKLFYTLLAMNSTDIEYYYTTESTQFKRAIVNNNYDKIVVIVVGLEDTSSFDYTFEGGTPYISIESPQPSPVIVQARVGPHNNPEKFISIVDIAFQEDPSVQGFFTENFRVTVGANNVTVLAAVNVYGKYYLQIQAPEQESDGLYDLTVDLVDSDGIAIDTDIEDLCVNYGDTYYDIMLSIDKSSSMNDNGKIDAAKSASKLLVDSFSSEDLLGVVEFEENANTIHDLMLLNSINRVNASNAIDAIFAGGGTSVGDGLFNSQYQLFTNGIVDNPDHIIILSDGRENEPQYIADVLHLILGNNTIVHVISIGSDAADEDLQALTAVTGGTYFYCFDPASGDIPNDLAELYRAITENVRHLERFYHSRGSINPGNSKVFHMDITEDMDLVEFVVHYNATIQPTSVTLKDPEKNIVSFNYTNDKSGMGYAVGSVNNPKIGKWEIEILVGSGSSELKYFVEGAAHSSVSMTLLAPPYGITSPLWGTGEPIGKPIPVKVSLTDNKAIQSAKIYMNVTPPGYINHNYTFQISLYDDGNHGDQLPDDGIYGNFYTATSEEGSYQFVINATGINSEGSPFTRIKTGAFYMYQYEYSQDHKLKTLKVHDTDIDGLPDHWEKYYGLKSTDGSGENGPDGDPDLDWLKNIDEFFHGTDPLNSDTDYGGQGDNSEVHFGLNPLDPSDDSMDRFPTIRIFPGNNFVYILMPNNSATNYNNLYIYRSTHPIEGYSIIYSSSYIGDYNDTSVTNYNTYYYRFLADSAPFNETSITRPFRAIPKLNVLAAEASVLINNGNKTTTSNLVDVKIKISLNDETTKIANIPTHMRFSQNAASVSEASWIAFDSQFPVLLRNKTGVHFIFVQLRDDQVIPEISPLFSAGITYTGENPSSSIGLGTTITLFMITVDFAVVTIIFYRKKRKLMHLKSK